MNPREAVEGVLDFASTGRAVHLRDVEPLRLEVAPRLNIISGGLDAFDEFVDADGLRVVLDVDCPGHYLWVDRNDAVECRDAINDLFRTRRTIHVGDVQLHRPCRWSVRLCRTRSHYRRKEDCGQTTSVGVYQTASQLSGPDR